MALIWNRHGDDCWTGYPPGSDLATASPYVNVDPVRFQNATLWKVWYVSICEEDVDVFLDDIIAAKESAEDRYRKSQPLTIWSAMDDKEEMTLTVILSDRKTVWEVDLSPLTDSKRMRFSSVSLAAMRKRDVR